MTAAVLFIEKLEVHSVEWKGRRIQINTVFHQVSEQEADWTKIDVNILNHLSMNKKIRPVLFLEKKHPSHRVLTSVCCSALSGTFIYST